MYKDIGEDVETRFDIANYVLNRPLPKGRKQNVIGLIKNEVDENHERIVRLRAITCSCLAGNNYEDKKAKGTKKVCHRKKT